MILPLLAIVAAIFVITTKNAIISVFNLIVLYILVAFYLIYIGITYLGISYIVVYIGAIAILFLFVIMMIDIEVVEKRSNNYLPLLFLLFGGFFFTLKNILYNIGVVKMKSFSINFIRKPVINQNLFNIESDEVDSVLLEEYIKKGIKKASDDSDSFSVLSEENNKVNPFISDEDEEVVKLSKILLENKNYVLADKDKYYDKDQEKISSWIVIIKNKDIPNEMDEKNKIKNIVSASVAVDKNKSETLKEKNVDKKKDNTETKTKKDEDYKIEFDEPPKPNFNSIDTSNLKYNETDSFQKWHISEMERNINDLNYLLKNILIRDDEISNDGENNLKSELEEDNELNINVLLENSANIKKKDIWDWDIKFDRSISYKYEEELHNYNYLLVVPDWDSAANRATQISAIGDVLYTVYHSFIYIISVLLLLGMIGAIILTADNFQVKEVKLVKKLISDAQIQEKNKIKEKKNYSFSESNKLSGFYNPWLIIKSIYHMIISISFVKIITFIKWNIDLVRYLNLNIYIRKIKLRWIKIRLCKKFNYIKKGIRKTCFVPLNLSVSIRHSLILPFFDISNFNFLHSENIIGNLFYFIIATLIIAALLLFINSYFSLSIKYLDKGGGFECGFTSFVQTRERFNVIFYRVSLLFLVFDLEIILIFPYTAIYQKYQNISKNNVLAFLYILIVGFIYELKEGALNIVKKAHMTETY